MSNATTRANQLPGLSWQTPCIFSDFHNDPHLSAEYDGPISQAVWTLQLIWPTCLIVRFGSIYRRRHLQSSPMAPIAMTEIDAGSGMPTSLSLLNPGVLKARPE